MEEYIYLIRKYLPLEFSDSEADEFLNYLEEAYLGNIENEKYQFAFSAFHMLYMAFIYKIKWFLREQGNSKIEKDLQNYINQYKRTVFNTLFDLSQIPEKASLESLLQALSFHANEVGICKNHVDIRNNCLHSSGKIYYKKVSQVVTYIEEELDYIKRIQEKITPYLKNLLENFIDKNWNKNITIKDWLVLNYISEKDLEILVIIDLPIFKRKSDTQEIIFKKLLNIVFISEAQKFIEIENKLIIEKLPSFVNGLPKEIEITKEDGEQKKILTQEIIEGYLIPIISQFSEKDREKSEKILSL